MYFSEIPPPAFRHLISFHYQMGMTKTLPGSKGEMLLPSGSGIMGFHVKGRYFVDTLADFSGKLPKNYLIGQQTISYRLSTPNPQVLIFGLALQPTAIWKLFRIPVFKLTNYPMELSGLIGEEFSPYLDRINLADTPEEKMIRAYGLIEVLDRRSEAGRSLVDFGLELILAKKGCITTREICKELHVSERHLQHLFRQQVGVSPLSYARITRFNAIFTEFAKSDEPKDIQFLMSFYNYYDSSHFIKDFKSFCGQAPSQFHLDQFQLLRQLMEKDPYLIQVRGKFT